MSAGFEVAKRLVLAFVVAVLVVGVSAVGPLLAPSGDGVEAGPSHPAYDAGSLAPDRLESSGRADPSGDVGVVLFDRSHGNRFALEDVSPLTNAIERAGGDVRFSERTGSLQQQLREADVLVVIDPASPYDPEEVDAVEEFVDNGGRVVIVGEPNRKAIQQQGLTAVLATQRARLTELASAFGISFGTHYLYDMRNNDGNFKNVLVGPPDGTGADAVEGVESVAMYTAVEVEANRGTVLLRTAPTAERANDETTDGFPVAVLSADGSVMAVGDKTFVSDEFHSVADNDVFIARMVEFMAFADHDPPEDGSGEESGRTEEPPNPASARVPG